MVTDLTEGKPSKVLFYFTLPMLLGNIFQQLYNLADSVIVGNVVGPAGLAAVGCSFPISFLAIGLATGASQGCSIIISRFFGSKDYDRLRTSFSTALISVVSLGVIVWILSFFTMKPLLRALKTDPKIFDATYSYVQIVFLGCIFLFMYNCLTAIFNSLGDSKTPLKFLIGSTLLNVVLDILFVAYFKMGVNGAAIATLTAQILSAVGMLIYFFIKVKKMGFGKGKFKLFDVEILKGMSIIAFPTMLQQSMVSIGMMAVQGLVNSFGLDVTAGYTAASKIDSIAVMPSLNIGIALSSYTAQNLGAGRAERVKQGYKAAITMTLIISAAISLVTIFFGKYFVRAFLMSDSGVNAVEYGAQYLNVVSVFYILFGIMCVTNGILRGARDMKAFMLSTLVNIVSRIALAYVLAPVMGYSSLFWSIPLGWLLSGGISFTRYISGKWKNKA